MRECILGALNVYRDKETMNKLIYSAMSTDFGFELSALEYAKHYIWLI